MLTIIGKNEYLLNLLYNYIYVYLFIPHSPLFYLSLILIMKLWCFFLQYAHCIYNNILYIAFRRSNDPVNYIDSVTINYYIVKLQSMHPKFCRLYKHVSIQKVKLLSSPQNIPLPQPQKNGTDKEQSPSQPSRNVLQQTNGSSRIFGLQNSNLSGKGERNICPG